MNYLFLISAGVLIFLGAYLYASKKDRLSLQFLIFATGLSAWNICIFLLNEFPLHINVNLVSRLQLILSMVFVNGIYYFCSSYPYAQRKHKYILNLSCAFLLSAGLVFTSYITEAGIVNEEVVNTHGFGFFLYGIYISVLSYMTATRLLNAYRQNPDYRDRLKYMLIGLGIFAFFIIACVALLPLIGIGDLIILGYLSSIFPALFFAYAITKYDFMDIGVIINRKTAWILTISIIVFSFILVYQLKSENDFYRMTLLTLLGVFWAVSAIPFQKLLLTSARRKFIRSWYNTEDLISEISTQLTAEKNRESIFITIEKIIDDAFQLERSELIFAVRDETQNLSHYLSVKKSSQGIIKHELKESKLIDAYAIEVLPDLLENCELEVQKYLLEEGFKKENECIVVPFYSPEFLEGILILGERSSREIYTNRDMRFFIRLVNYMSAILYRLTPFEQLESQYFENRQKLHEAEIQLLRAQKIESIVHATRQCHHEIRTPLNIISLGIGRVKTQKDLDSYTQMAKEEIRRALEIVEETLVITDVSKAPEERVESFNPNEVLLRCARLVDANRFELNMSQGEIPEIMGVLSDIQVVITNLLHNAMEVMPNGGKLSLKSYCVADRVIIEVEDNGPGISDELRSKVWEPYFSGQGTTVGNSSAGRGWGLTIVNRIITEHRGTINFTSELGVGTKFIISLPMAKNLD